MTREIDIADVVCVPSYYSEFDQITVHLKRQGYDVLNVGDDDWNPVPSLLPYIRGADIDVCSGYLTIMDAAVTGTSCVISPATVEQEAVAEWIDGSDIPGFTVARNALDILGAVDSPPVPPSYENGAARIAETVVDDLLEPRGQESPSVTGEVAQRVSESVSNPLSAKGAASLRSHLLGPAKSDIGASFSVVAEVRQVDCPCTAWLEIYTDNLNSADVCA